MPETLSFEFMLMFVDRSPPVPQNMPGFNTYTGQLSVSAADNANTQWPAAEGES